jgi:hypothetical protein
MLYTLPIVFLDPLFLNHRKKFRGIMTTQTPDVGELNKNINNTMNYESIHTGEWNESF